LEKNKKYILEKNYFTESRIMKQENRVSPYFSDAQVKILDELIDKVGCTRADVVKQLALIKLTEMGYFNKHKKN
jgi:hypothetical protein